MNRRRYITVTCLLALLACTGQADVPPLLNYQGRLLDGTNPVTDTVSMALRIYTNDTSGDFLYEDSNTVAVLDGVYATLIGDDTIAGDLIAALEIAGSSAYLGVIVNGIEVLPRARMASSAFSLLTGPKGTGNKEAGLFAAVGGGATNFAFGASSVIDGGQFNSVTNGSSFSTIGGGWKNLIGSFSLYSVIAGGLQNTIDPDTFYGTIGGGYENDLGSESYYSTIAGGSGNDIAMLARYASVGGGWDNDIADDAEYATIGGGSGNDILDAAAYSVIGGGCANDIMEGSLYSAISGGRANDIGSNAHYSAIGGGATNKIGINAHYAVIPGGRDNEVNAAYGHAAGYRAKADHAGSFVWADAQASDFRSTSSNQFLIRATGGVGIGTDDPGSSAVRVAGVVESTAGGFKFPDGSVQLSSSGAIAGTPNPWTFAVNNIYNTNSGNVSIGTSSTAEKLTVAGHIAASLNNVYNLGNPSLAWKALYLGSLIDHDDTLNFVNNGDITMILAADGKLTVSNTVTATSFIGDGASLTGVTPGNNSVNSDTVIDGTLTSDDVDTDTFDTTFWKADGNNGLSGGTEFLGTLDTTELEFRVENRRVLVFHPDLFSPRIAGGYESNSVGTLSHGSAVLSGGGFTFENTVGETNDWSVVAGGAKNTIGDGANYATISGGFGNTISNVARYATIPGGYGNRVGEEYSLAAGRQAAAAHKGCFVWADSSEFDFGTTAENQFRVRAVGGADIITGIDGSGALTAGVTMAPGASAWSALSDRASKENIEAVDGREVLRKLDQIEIARWNWIAQDDSIEHVGPMAQDFHAAFGLGESDRRISTVDADGIALAAVQGLYRIVQEKDAEIAALTERLERLEAALAPPASSD